MVESQQDKYMFYSDVICGYFVDLRSIDLGDAEFSYQIRADKKNRETVGTLATSVDSQRAFIKWQIEQPNDYYFVIQNKYGEKIGLIGVYDIHGDIAEIGREVCVGEPEEILEAEFLVSLFCMETLKLKKICYVVYSNNIHHAKELEKRGGILKGKVIRNGHEAFYFEQDLLTPNKTTKRISSILARLFAARSKN